MSITTDTRAGETEEEKPGIGLIILLGVLTAFGPMSIDMYLPGLPQIARSYGVSAAAAQLTVVSFLVGNACGQILYGPLSDRVGRRTPLLVGLSCYGIASLFCALAPTVELLIFFRFLQAIGGCAGQVIARAIVRDRFHASEAARIFSLLTLVMGVAPIFAPSLGGLVMSVLGWRSIFGILFVFSAVTGTIAYFRLPESRHESERARSRAESMRGSIAAVLSNRRFLGYALGGSLVTFSMFAYIGSASDVFINMYGFSPSLFGLAFSLNASGYIAAAQFNRTLLRHYTSDQILRAATWIGAGAGLWILCDASFGIGGAAGLLAPIFVVCSALGVLQPNALAGAMTTDPYRTGTISALFGMMQAGAGAVGASLSAALHNGTPLPMALIIAGGFSSALIMYRVLPPWPPRRVVADS